MPRLPSDHLAAPPATAPPADGPTEAHERRRAFAHAVESGALAGPLRWAAGLLVLFLLLSAAGALFTNSAAVLGALARFGAPALATLLLLPSLAFALRALRWHVYARAQAMPIPLLDDALVYVGGFALGATPGRIGEAVRLLLLRDGFGLPFRRTAPLLIADRLNDVNTLALLMLLGAAWALRQQAIVWLALGLVLAVNVALRHPAPLIGLVGALHGLAGRRWPRAAAAARRLLRRVQGTFGARTQLVASTLSLLAWGAECTCLYWILGTLGAPIDLRAAVAVHATASLVGALSMLPGGLGGFEATCVALLAWQGVPAPVAVAATALLRVVTFWYSIVLGIPALALARARMRARRTGSA